MRRISIGSWAYTIGPYAGKPIDFDTVCQKLKELGYDGVKLGGFAPHPNPDDCPEKSQRDEVVAKMQQWGLSFSGLAANLWGEQLANTDDHTKYIAEFTKNAPRERIISARAIMQPLPAGTAADGQAVPGDTRLGDLALRVLTSEAPVPVLGEDGSVAGVVTRDALVQALYGEAAP